MSHILLLQVPWHLDQMFLNLKMKIEIVMVIAVLGIVCAKTAFIHSLYVIERATVMWM